MTTQEINKTLHELLGKCWHELPKSLEKAKTDKYGTHLCLKCNEPIHKWHWDCSGDPRPNRVPSSEYNPDYCADPRLVIKAMMEREDWPEFLKTIGNNKCYVPVIYNYIPRGQMLDEVTIYGIEVIKIDLIMDTTGKLALLAIGWLRREK